jgi:hypothetical protein
MREREDGDPTENGDDGGLENFVGVQNPITADEVRDRPLWGTAGTEG